MRSSEKRHRLIEFLNYLTHHEHKSIYPINETIQTFTMKTNITLAQSTAYRIIKKYIDQQREGDLRPGNLKQPNQLQNASNIQ